LFAEFLFCLIIYKLSLKKKLFYLSFVLVFKGLFSNCYDFYENILPDY